LLNSPAKNAIIVKTPEIIEITAAMSCKAFFILIASDQIGVEKIFVKNFIVSSFSQVSPFNGAARMRCPSLPMLCLPGRVREAFPLASPRRENEAIRGMGETAHFA